MKKVAKPPRTSRDNVEPRWVIWKNESSKPCEGAVFWSAAGEGMAQSVGRRLRSIAGGTHRLAGVSPEEPQPLDVDIGRVLEIGTALWAAALVVTMLVPALHQGDRQWWPWTCVAGMVGGLVALLYIRRGHGNAAMAHPPA